MKTLFNEYEAQNEDANKLEEEIEAAIHPIIMKYWKSGFTFREILAVIQITISTMVSIMILSNAADMMKKQRMEKR